MWYIRGDVAHLQTEHEVRSAALRFVGSTCRFQHCSRLPHPEHYLISRLRIMCAGQKYLNFMQAASLSFSVSILKDWSQLFGQKGAGRYDVHACLGLVRASLAAGSIAPSST
jgi:hypothetical protein